MDTPTTVLLPDEDEVDIPDEVAATRGWVKIENEFDPDRCEGVGRKGGQCLFKRCAPSKFCMRHGASQRFIAEKKERHRNYHLTKFRARINELADSPEIKSLREEIGIIRMMIETILNKCQDENDLIMFAGKLQHMIQQAQKLVESCHRLEERTGVLLDKQSILVVCDSLVKIIAIHVEDPDALDRIAEQMVDVVAKIGGIGNVTANAPTAA